MAAHNWKQCVSAKRNRIRIYYGSTMCQDLCWGLLCIRSHLKWPTGIWKSARHQKWLLPLLLPSRFSPVRLCVMAAHQAPLSLGFSRQEHWSGLPFPSPMHESEKWKWSHSVMSDSQWPHGLQPSRLLHPWDFPGKSTGVGCHCLLRLRNLNTCKSLDSLYKKEAFS